MNYTEKYHLPQWVKEDRIMMEDFNQMCADMEAGLVKTASSAASAASVASSGAAAAKNAQTAANTAQTAANAAQKTADAALTKASAAFSPDNLPCVKGSFIGTGEIQDIELGFRPQFLVVWGTGLTIQSSPATFVILTAGANAGGSWVTVTQTGFRVGPNNGGTSSFNTRGSTNWYIAFR